MVISFVCLLSQCLFLLSGTEILSTRLTNSIGPVGLKSRYETFPDSKFIHKIKMKFIIRREEETEYQCISCLDTK